MSQGLLAFHKVTFGYQRKIPPVIQSLDLALPEGKIISILGPNGAGKTTLLFLALGWLKPWEGEITLSGKNIGQFSRRGLGKQVALIPQSEYIAFETSVLEFVLLGRTPYLNPLEMPSARDEEIAYRSLEKVGAAHLYDHSMVALSGGERQLILAARALAQQPRLLLLDEPTSHLDLSNKYRMMMILKELLAEGTTILMTTHEPDLALAVSDEVILMEKGGIFAAGATGQVATGEALSSIYHVPVRIVEVEGRRQVLWM